jgi:creatinine amidohydrolase
MLPKRNWADMSWQEFSGADVRRWVAVLPVAATEQHGPHLPLGVDAIIGRAYIARVLPLLPPELPATFLPLQDIGVSLEHEAFPGTLTVSAATAIQAWTEIGASVARAGVRKLVIVTSHGGNVATIDIVARELRAHHNMLAVTCAWQNFGYPEGLFPAQERQHGIHGGGIETSIVLAAARGLVQMDKALAAISATVEMEKLFKQLRLSRPAGFGWMTQDLHTSGTVGDATEASAQHGEAALAHGAKAFLELLTDVDRFDLARLQEGPLNL